MPLGGAVCGAQPVGVEVDAFLPIAGQPPIEIRGALVARAAGPVKLTGLFDFSLNPSLAACELAGEITRSGMTVRPSRQQEAQAVSLAAW